MNSPLTTMPRRMAPRRMKSFSTNTPVSIPAHAFDRSKLVAACAPIASLIERLNGGSSARTRPWSG